MPHPSSPDWLPYAQTDKNVAAAAPSRHEGRIQAGPRDELVITQAAK
jgi:hypothetical protein